MVRRKDRSTSVRALKRRVPSGASRTRYKRRKKKGTGKCALCKRALHGVSFRGAKSKKKPSRRFGGNLCHKCAALVIKEAQRVREKTKTMEDVDIILRKYVQGIL
jgi:large subunit ribosomal protein L34e